MHQLDQSTKSRCTSSTALQSNCQISNGITDRGRRYRINEGLGKLSRQGAKLLFGWPAGLPVETSTARVSSRSGGLSENEGKEMCDAQASVEQHHERQRLTSSVVQVLAEASDVS
jgi:hypothetical protein